LAGSGSAKLVIGTTQRLSTASQRFQCMLAVLRTFVVPPSGSIFNNCWKSTSLPLPTQMMAAPTTIIETKSAMGP